MADDKVGARRASHRGMTQAYAVLETSVANGEPQSRTVGSFHDRTAAEEFLRLLTAQHREAGAARTYSITVQRLPTCTGAAPETSRVRQR